MGVLPAVTGLAVFGVNLGDINRNLLGAHVFPAREVHACSNGIKLSIKEHFTCPWAHASDLALGSLF